MLGGGDDVGLRCVDHHDPELGGPCHVDIVQTDASPTDDDELRSRLEHLGRHRGGGPDDQRVRAHNRTEQLLGGESQLDIDLVAGSGQLIKARLGDLLSDEDSCHVAPWFSSGEGGTANVGVGQSASAKSC